MEMTAHPNQSASRREGGRQAWRSETKSMDEIFSSWNFYFL